MKPQPWLLIHLQQVDHVAYAHLMFSEVMPANLGRLIYPHLSSKLQESPFYNFSTVLSYIHMIRNEVYFSSNILDMYIPGQIFPTAHRVVQQTFPTLIDPPKFPP